MHIQENVPLKEYTTLNIGGPARYFIEVFTQEELVEALKFSKEKNLKFLLIGGGSNLLVSDEGFDGLVIKNKISGIKTYNDQLIVEAGTDLSALVDYTIEHGLDGMSTMKGIPGTVGGAVYGSAGAYGDNIRDYLEEIEYLENLEVKKIDKTEYQTGYRDSLFKHNKSLIILRLTFSNFPKADTKTLLEESQKILKLREEKYPPQTMCPGSFFKNVLLEDLTDDQKENIKKALIDYGKNPEVILKFGKVPAGSLLELVGAKGDQIGEITVAQNHANTFINLGNGTSKDFYTLAKKWYLKVYEKFGIKIAPEVQFVNLPLFEV